MRIGLPKETKPAEARVALTPAAVDSLIHEGHAVRVQAGAGQGAGFPDEEYAGVGAELVPSAEAAWAADLVVKVKEPQPPEWAFFRPGLTLATYLHLAAEPDLTRALAARGVDSFGYETVQAADGKLPLLAPMSEIAGRMAAQEVAHYLEMPSGGAGMLIGGAPGVPPATVLVVGVGVVGFEAARVALGMGAQVVLADRNLDRLREVEHLLHGRFVTLASNTGNLRRAVAAADAVIGAVLIPGARAPRVVTEAMVASMRPGGVVVDVAIDQGGCIETSRPTTHANPTYIAHGVVHYCVTNMPGAVPHTSAVALSNAILPYISAIARSGLAAAAEANPVLRGGVNVLGGEVVHPAVAAALAGEPRAPERVPVGAATAGGDAATAGRRPDGVRTVEAQAAPPTLALPADGRTRR